MLRSFNPNRRARCVLTIEDQCALRTVVTTLRTVVITPRAVVIILRKVGITLRAVVIAPTVTCIMNRRMRRSATLGDTFVFGLGLELEKVPSYLGNLRFTSLSIRINDLCHKPCTSFETTSDPGPDFVPRTYELYTQP